MDLLSWLPVKCSKLECRRRIPIMADTRDGTLSCRFTNWDECAKITFHLKHWMNKDGCILYYKLLCSCYQGETIDFIWSTATSNLSDAANSEAAELIIVLGVAPGGCTSLIYEVKVSEIVQCLKDSK